MPKSDFTLHYFSKMKPDLKNRVDFANFVTEFYVRVLNDPLLGPIFRSVHQDDWDYQKQHLTDFWVGELLENHQHTDRDELLEGIEERYRWCGFRPDHFARWRQHHANSVNALFEGEMAKLLLERGQLVANELQDNMEDEHSDHIHCAPMFGRPALHYGPEVQMAAF